MGARAFVPARATLRLLASAVQSCEGCDLYRYATQAVFGEGKRSARIVMVGEQPGDKEDRAGKPFVGPAGEVLDRALDASGIDRADLYVTNAVKHFKFEERGKRRIHKKPSTVEIVACRPWLEAELGILKPEILVCLGATALESVMGKQYRVLRDRGQFFAHPLAGAVTVTVHPSSILRSPTPEERESAFQAMVRDLAAVKCKLAGVTPSP